MKYNICTDNFKNFNVFKDNVMYPRSYFIPYPSLDFLENVDIRNERYCSPMAECLSGEWDFVYYSNCKDIPEIFDTDSISFDKVEVPSTWQHTGYEKPYYVNQRYQFKANPPHIPEDCPAGIYRRMINIDDVNKNYYLCFLGVAGSLELFVNGKYVGYSEGSHNTSEFELNKFVKQGENEIVVVNHKWSNGTYLEAQDMFRCNGIFRDVLLYKTADNSIYDFEADIKYISDNQYSLAVKPSLKISEECELTAFLYDDGELIKSVSVNQTTDNLQIVDMGTLSVNEWSAETPYLYDLVLVLSQGDNIIEVIRKNIGFKHIEIKGNVFYFNNKPIKLLGVNHHDTNSKTGYVMTVADMEQDVSIIKEYNCNCIRTSHYPPDPTFLDLCDEYGIYVVDEADIETHGLEEIKRRWVCSHNPKWQQHYWDRVYRMFERDKNHSSITMWSLGNEAHGYKNQDYCYEQLKKLTSIPIHYEGVCRTRRWAYDVLSQMYTYPGICEKIAKGKGLPAKYYKKPFYLCEYAHAMGVGAGELERYVKCFYSAENMMGGCIWEFVDHAIYHENGKYEYTYGGDHGELKHDSNFCVDGLFFPDRTAHSGAKQMKACYRPVRAGLLDSDKYLLTNCRYFKNADMTVNYRILQNGISVKEGNFDISIKPQESIEYNIERFDYDESKNQVVQFEYIENGRAVGTEEIELSSGVFKFETKAKVPYVQNSEKRLFIDFDNGSMIFDKSTGFIDSYMIGDKELVNPVPYGDAKGLSVQFYRAPLDNDMYISTAWNKARLADASSFVKNVKCVSDNSSLKISYVTTVKTPVRFIAKVFTVLHVYSSGEIKVDYKVLSDGNIKYIPRFSVQLELNKQFKNIKYLGLGPDINLSDYKEHALMGIYETDIDSMYENYIKPQESATRCNTSFAEITDDEGTGICIEAINKPFVFSAKPFTSQQCAKASHRDELEKTTCCINIDYDDLGAGSNACGPLPSKQNCLGKLKGKTLSFVIKPLGEKNV
ncbi:MAG: hypothetical protein NC213_10440 [Acetobacter sp.]|nr:hypothetical protein [Bacteroides sp.]MCM1342153.1 hypothetical protein [Acetobacter sp.]MCM1434381.1 hypothetical protein [Clostridiales bacterium]